MKTLLYSAVLTALLLSTRVFSHDWETSRPDGHAPISVMQDHTHKAGELMVSYRYMLMDMEGMQKEGSDLSKH